MFAQKIFYNSLMAVVVSCSLELGKETDTMAKPQQMKVRLHRCY